MSLIFGIDYGNSRNDIPMFSVIKKEKDKIIMIDSGRMEEFNYEKYIALKHQIIGDEKYRPIQVRNKNSDR